MAQLSSWEWGPKPKAWLSHYGSCHKDFAASHVTEALKKCHYPAKCWPLITQMSAKNDPKVSLGLTQGKRWTTAFNSSQRGDMFVKKWSLSTYSSGKEQNEAWAKCGSNETRSKLVTWQSNVFPFKPLTCCSCQIGPRLWWLYWRWPFFCRLPWKKKFLCCSWVVVKEHHSP